MVSSNTNRSRRDDAKRKLSEPMGGKWKNNKSNNKKLYRISLS